MTSKAREFDVVIFGATGYTGQLVAEYLVNSYTKGHSGEVPDSDSLKNSLKFAFAARNNGKLTDLKNRLASLLGVEAAKEVPTIECSSESIDMLKAMTARTKVVMSTVGPFAIYGSPLLEACLETETHYCDLTGETFWVRDNINAHHEKALQKKVKLVHCCGFDSVPSDMGTLLATAHFKQKYGGKIERVDFRILKTRGGVSGGTLASMYNMLTVPKATRNWMADPYFLCGNSTESNKTLARVEQPPHDGVMYDSVMEKYSVKFVMEMINSRVVRRSNYLLNNIYGDQFKYSERLSVGGSWLVAQMARVAMKTTDILLEFAPTRKLISWLLYKPGEGPSKATRDGGYFWAKAIATGKTAEGEEKHVVVKVGSDKGDGGYKETAKMLAETAICLAFPSTPKDSSVIFPKTVDGGVLTPASAAGSQLLDRLRNAGMTFKLVEEGEKEDVDMMKK